MAIFVGDSTEYNTYEFELTSDVDQDIWVSLYTYSDLQYVATCYETFYNSEVYVTSDQHSDIYIANPGAAHMDKIRIQAASDSRRRRRESVKVQVYTSFSR